jgi:hypothetical protein
MILCLIFCVIASTSNAMEFREAGAGGNCTGCFWIVAEGEITKETPIEFERFLAHEARPFKVVFNSPGGNLFAGIELGRIIRKSGLHTTVAKSRRADFCNDDADCPSYLEDLEPGVCFSACAYAFLGGVQRQVADADSYSGNGGSIIGFHQFYGDLDKQSRIAQIIEEETYFSNEQLVSAFILKYLTDMEVDPNVLGIAALAGPDQMEFPNKALRKSLKIDYKPDFSFGELDLEVYKDGLLGFSKPNYVNDFNEINQITFYCRDQKSLNLLITISQLRFGDKMIGETFGEVLINLNKGDTFYDKPNDSLVFGYDRVREWSDENSSYINIKLNTNEKYQIINSVELAIYLNVARAFGNHKAYLTISDQARQSLKLIERNCF